MTCQDRDSDLLLFGLGELSPWQRRKIARHLRTCDRCRARQRELSATATQIGAALKPPMRGDGQPYARKPLRPTSQQPAFAPLIVALIIALVAVSAVGVWYIRSRAQARPVATDVGCLPGLSSDKCR